MSKERKYTYQKSNPKAQDEHVLRYLWNHNKRFAFPVISVLKREKKGLKLKKY
jgi:hypothetical protein